MNTNVVNQEMNQKNEDLKIREKAMKKIVISIMFWWCCLLWWKFTLPDLLSRNWLPYVKFFLTQKRGGTIRCIIYQEVLRYCLSVRKYWIFFDKLIAFEISGYSETLVLILKIFYLAYHSKDWKRCLLEEKVII